MKWIVNLIAPADGVPVVVTLTDAAVVCVGPVASVVTDPNI